MKSIHRSLTKTSLRLVVGAVGLSGLLRLGAEEIARWGHGQSGNQVSGESGLVTQFDPKTGLHLDWSARLGTEAHSTPIIADGRVFIGTNNNEPRDAKHQGDRGVLMCFNEEDGSMLWQLVVPKRAEDRYFDWPNSGISSPATVEGDRVYIVTNRGELACLDVRGLADGNDGPFLDEARHMTPSDYDPLSLGPLDADIVWLFDLTEGAGIWSHDGAHSSVLVEGNYLYLNTGTGVDNSHRRIRRPNAPSLVVIDKRTGELVAREQEGIGPNIFHCTWSAPTLARMGEQSMLLFAAGNGMVYSFDLISESRGTSSVGALEKRWQFDFDPTAPKENVHRFHQNKREGPSNFYGMPVVVGEKAYLAGGGDLWWGKNESWLKCINLSDRSASLEWSYELGRHVMSTPAVIGDLVFIADNSRVVHCVDRATGKGLWTHETKGEFWASPYVADGKVFIGNRKGEFFVFSASGEKQILHQIHLGAPISATAVAANGTLYVATMFQLYAFRSEASPRSLSVR
jgi:outer membrane protein assembly factor BamB